MHSFNVSRLETFCLQISNEQPLDFSGWIARVFEHNNPDLMRGKSF